LQTEWYHALENVCSYMQWC